MGYLALRAPKDDDAGFRGALRSRLQAGHRQGPLTGLAAYKVLGY